MKIQQSVMEAIIEEALRRSIIPSTYRGFGVQDTPNLTSDYRIWVSYPIVQIIGESCKVATCSKEVYDCSVEGDKWNPDTWSELFNKLYLEGEA